jgi:hypothetical protein
MDFDGLDRADNTRTSARRKGDTVSTQHIYKYVNTFYPICLVEIEEHDVILASKWICIF